MMTEKESHEFQRLQEIDRAWNAVFSALLKGNRDTFQGPGSGTECALREIARLQENDKVALLVARIKADMLAMPMPPPRDEEDPKRYD